MRSLVSVEHSQNAPRGEKAESTRRIERATSAALAMQRRDWEQGVFAQAMLQSGQRELLIQLTKAAMVQQTPDGRMGVVVNGGPKDDESAARFGRPSGTRNPICLLFQGSATLDPGLFSSVPYGNFVSVRSRSLNFQDRFFELATFRSGCEVTE